MKIIFITREGYNLPGARVRCYNFARELKRYGLQTEVLSFSDSLGAKDGKEEWKMSATQKITYNTIAFKKLAKEKDAIFIMHRLHYHSFGPYLAYLLNRDRLVFDLDDWEMRENPTYYFRIYPSSKAEFLTRRIASRSNICIAASKYLENYLSQFNKRAYYLPSGVDTELFKPVDGNSDDSKIIFSWTGTIHNRDIIENLKFIMECFSALRKKYSHIFLEIVGDGFCFDDFVKMADERRDGHIRIKGWIHPNDMPRYLSTIDIGLVPLIQNTRFNRAKSPVKLFEYMAMGKPTISSDIGEAANIIEDGANGMLAKTRGEFVRKIEDLILDRKLREEIGKRARFAVTKNYSLAILGKQLYEILRRI